MLTFGLTNRSRRRYLAVFGALSLLFSLVAQTGFSAGLPEAEAVTIPPNFFTVVDQGGPNDEVNQGDLTQMGRDETDSSIFKLFWSWDDVDFTSQTGDACALFDYNGNGNVDAVVCGQIRNATTWTSSAPVIHQTSAVPQSFPQGWTTGGSPFVFRCTDASPDRCSQPSAPRPYVRGTDVTSGVLGTLATSPPGNLVTDTDPFAAGSFFPNDSTLQVNILKTFLTSLAGNLGNKYPAIPNADPELVNVCTYPSAGSGGNNDPKDCIVTPGGGFLVIKKDAGANTTTDFVFTVNPGPGVPGSPSTTYPPKNYTIKGTGQTQPIGLAVGTATESVTEALPSGWQLDAASCLLDDGTTATGTRSGTAVNGITIQSGKVTTCTFTNSLVPSNTPPVAVDDTVSTTEDTSVDTPVADLLSNDTDPDVGDTLTVTSVQAPTGGTVALVDGVVTFTPTGNLCGDGAGSYTYTISDGNGGTDTATVTVDIACVNDGPVAVDDTVSTTEDTSVDTPVADLLSNDTDPDVGDTLTVTSVQAPTGGTVALVDGVVTFTPTGNLCGDGAGSYTYTISDGNGGTDTATVTVDIACVNDGPVAVDDTVSTTEDTSVDTPVADLLSNDTDPDVGDTLTVTSVQAPTGGTVALVDGVVTFTPTGNLCGDGAGSYTYTISDGNGGTDTATVTVDIACVNDGPVAVDDTVSTTEDTSVDTPVADLLSNDTDPDVGDTLTVTSVQAPTGGTVALVDGVVTFTPTGNLCGDGAGSYTYTISDGNGGTDTATVTVDIACVNDGPVAVDDTVSTTEDTSVDTPVADLLSNDTDPDVGDTLTVTSVQAPTGGTVALVDGVVTFTPTGNLCGDGAGSYTYTISDGNGGTDTATVTVDIACVNDGPVAVDDTVSTTEDTSVDTPVADLLSNDTDPDVGDTLTVTSVQAPTGGTVALVDGVVTFTPTGNLCGDGAGSYTYTISDGNGGTDTATVTVDIACVNDGPVAVDDTVSTTEDTSVDTPVADLLSNDTDPDVGDTLTVTSVQAPTGGTVALVDGVVTFTPTGNLCGDGAGSYTYTISDGNGGTDTATVTVDIACVNDGPVAVDDTVSTTEDTSVDTPVADLLSNDTDPDVGDTLTVTSVQAPTGGTVALVDGVVTFTPTGNLCGDGAGSYTYTISDGNGGTDTATVTVDIACVNDGPVAVDDTVSTTEDTSVDTPVADLLSNDTDPDVGDTLTVTSVQAPTGGTVALVDGVVTFTPTGNLCGDGAGSYTYTISDGNGGTDTATVTVDIACVNDGPVAVDDTVSTTEDTSVDTPVADLLSNDTDPDVGDTLTVTSVQAPTGGTVALVDGVVTFTPTGNLCGDGAGSYTYTISDGNGGTDTATVTVDIACVNDGPVAVDDTVSTTEDTSVDTPVADLLSNDTDPDVGDTLTVTSVQAPTGGTVALVDGVVTFTPTGNLCGDGAGSYTYTISDGNGGTDTATVTVDIACVNDGPVAVNDTGSTDEDTVLNVVAPGVLGNDTDVDEDTLTVTKVNGSATNVGEQVTLASGALLTVEADGSYSYDPNGQFDYLDDGESTTDSYTYEACDPSGLCDTATVTITVTGVDDPLVAAPDTNTVAEGGSLTVTAAGVLSNDSDPDTTDNPLAVSAVEGLAVNVGEAVDGSTGGKITIESDGSYTFSDPDGDFNYLDDGESTTTQVTYTVVNQDGATESTTLTITVTGVDDPLVAAPDTNTVAEGGSLTVTAAGVLSNDSDPDTTDNPLAVSAVEGLAVNVGEAVDGSTGGKITIESDGSYTFSDPDGDFNYLDDGESTTTQVTYTVVNQDGATESTTLTITVTGVDDPLVAAPDTNTVAEGGSLTVTAAGVLSNDSDPDTTDNPLAVSAVEGLAVNVGEAVDGSTGGKITIESDGSYTFSDPDGDFNYLDDGESTTTQVTYTVVNQDGATESTTLTITVTGVDDPLVAAPDTNTVAEGGSLTVTAAGVLSNDSDPDTTDNPLAVSAVEGLAVNVGEAVDGSTGGKITIESDGSYTFSDPDGDFNYLDDGESTTTQVTYTVVNQDGATESTTLTITVTGVDDPLVAAPDTNTVAEGGSLTVTAAGVLSNDSDPDTTDNPLAVSAVEGLAVNVGEAVDGSTGGKITIESDGSYTFSDPDGDFNYLDDGESTTTQVTYTVVNQDGATESTTLTITVTGVDDPLVAAPDTNTVAEGGSLTVTAAGVLSNDSDPDTTDNPLAVSAVEGLAVNVGEAVDGSTGGKITIESDGSYTFSDPDGDFNYLDDGESTTTQVTYTVVNQDGATESTTLTITVTGVDDPLVAAPDTNTVAEGGSLTVTAAGVLSNDSDPDTTDNPLAVSAVEGLAVNVGEAVDGSTGGKITIESDGSYTFSDPDGDFNYLDDGESTTTQVTYTVVNQDGATESTTLTITVTGVDDPLVAAPDTNTVAEGGSLTVTAAGVLSNDSDPDTTDNPLAVSAVEGLAVNVGEAVDGSTGGKITIESDGSYTFSDPDGDFNYLDDGESTTTQVTYTVVNQDGATESTTLTITVTGVDDPLVALDDVDSTNEDTVLTVAAAAGVLSNDSDPDTTDNPLVVNNINDGTTDYAPGVQITTSGGGLLTVNADGRYSFDPNGAYEYLAVGESTSEQVTYTVVNQDDATETATLTITITGVNDDPVANDDDYLGLLNTPLTIAAAGVLGNDTDVDATDTLTVVSNTDPLSGAVIQNGDGSFTFTPKADFCGTDSYTYTISDGNGGSATATVTVFVQCPIISIDKQTADDYGNEADGLGVLPGENVTWIYYVSNDGNVVLENVVVSDDKLGTLSGPVTLLGPVSGDDNNDGVLDLDETWLYTATGTAESDWYYNTGSAVADGYSDSAGNTLLPSDSDVSSYYGLTPGVVTNSSLCDFGDQFRLLFTPDMKNYSAQTPAYKLSDSNPGQFFYNVFYVNDGSTDTITMEIPYPYVTQGGNPVHVYGGLTVDETGDGTDINCFNSTNDLASYATIFGLGDYDDTNEDGVIGYGDVYLVEVPAEDGFQYINIHLDYGLEKTNGWVKKGANVDNDQAINSDPLLAGVSIDDNTAHTYQAYADDVLIAGSTDTVYNLNEFKQIRGFGGFVYQKTGTTAGGEPIYGGLENAQVQLRGPDGAVIETMTADADGWFLSNYQHKGKAKAYTMTYNGQTSDPMVVGGKVKYGEWTFYDPPLTP